MKTLKSLWIRYGMSQEAKTLYVLATLVALAVASGAPGAGSGSGSIGGF